jgi:hypothetical protein
MTLLKRNITFINDPIDRFCECIFVKFILRIEKYLSLILLFFLSSSNTKFLNLAFFSHSTQPEEGHSFFCLPSNHSQRMKPQHYFVILLIISLIQNPAFSQSPSTIGVSAGVNLPNVDFKNIDGESTEQYIGYYGGLRAQIPIKVDFSLVSNLIYSRKGWHIVPSPVVGSPSGQMNLDYLDLQLSGQYAITKSLAVNAGVEVGRLLNTTNTIEPDEDFWNDLYQKGDFSLLMGVSYTIWKVFRLDARYLHGISHVYKGNFTDINGVMSGEVKDGTFGVFQFGISADIIKMNSTDKQKV